MLDFSVLQYWTNGENIAFRHKNVFSKVCIINICLIFMGQKVNIKQIFCWYVEADMFENFLSRFSLCDINMLVVLCKK